MCVCVCVCVRVCAVGKRGRAGLNIVAGLAPGRLTFPFLSPPRDRKSPSSLQSRFLYCVLDLIMSLLHSSHAAAITQCNAHIPITRTPKRTLPSNLPRRLPFSLLPACFRPYATQHSHLPGLPQPHIATAAATTTANSSGFCSPIPQLASTAV